MGFSHIRAESGGPAACGFYLAHYSQGSLCALEVVHRDRRTMLRQHTADGRANPATAARH
jgi:hypothetical protein